MKYSFVVFWIVLFAVSAFAATVNTEHIEEFYLDGNLFYQTTTNTSETVDGPENLVATVDYVSEYHVYVGEDYGDLIETYTWSDNGLRSGHFWSQFRFYLDGRIVLIDFGWTGEAPWW